MSLADDPIATDHYETLQLSPYAHTDTVERVFRHLAKRFHPDNTETGDAQRFSAVVEAYRVLSDPERRAAYDAAHAQQREDRWQIFDQDAAGTTPESDQRVRLGILSVLYQSRRRDVDRPGVGILELERILDCPQDHMRFHLWYMKEKGWVERRDNGTLAITVAGLDHLNSQEIPWARPSHQLRAVHGTGTAG
jgi:curved DNA-binding protein CbpA